MNDYKVQMYLKTNEAKWMLDLLRAYCHQTDNKVFYQWHLFQLEQSQKLISQYSIKHGKPALLSKAWPNNQDNQSKIAVVARNDLVDS